MVDVNGSEVPLAAPAEAAAHQPPGYSSDKEAYLRRLKGLKARSAASPGWSTRSAACCASGNPTHHHTVGLVTSRPSTDKEPAMSTVSTTVNVSGMTCGHCVSSVSEELEALAGVETVDVDLNAGGVSTVTITSTEELSSAEIGEAVAEAGYLVVANEA
jgi:copper chaperone CopZ